MVEITLFEVHVEDASFDANAEAIANAPLSGLASLLGRGSDGEDASEPPTETSDAESESVADVESEAESGGRPGPSVGKLLLLVVALAVAAVVARRVVGGGDDETAVAEDDEPEIAEIDVGE
jgi:hypothetical protein